MDQPFSQESRRMNISKIVRRPHRSAFSERHIPRLLVSLFVLFCSPAIVSASSDQAVFKVLSEYAENDEWRFNRSQVWEVHFESDGDRQTRMTFFRENANAADPACRVLVTPQKNRSDKIEWVGMGQGEQRVNEGILIVEGFPAPCDVLPQGRLHGEDSFYHQKLVAGGESFVKRYQVIKEAVGLEEANARGWLKADPGPSGKFSLLTVTDPKRNVILRQLWPLDGRLWVYEETPHRRSWRVDK